MQLGGGGIGLWEPGGRVRGYLVTGMDGKPISAICYVQLELELGDGRFPRRIHDSNGFASSYDYCQ